MAAISAKLQDFITQANLKDDVAKWLVKVGMLGYEEVALLAVDLASVTPGFFAAIKAANVDSMKEWQLALGSLGLSSAFGCSRSG